MVGKQLEARRWIAWGTEYLRQRPVVEVRAFEDAVIERFRGEMTEVHDRPLAGRSRDRKRNLTDHVKAQLTRRGLIEYLDLAGRQFIVFTQPVGAVDGVGEIVPLAAARRLVAAFAEAVRASDKAGVRS